MVLTDKAVKFLNADHPKWKAPVLEVIGRHSRQSGQVIAAKVDELVEMNVLTRAPAVIRQLLRELCS